ncbi:hypothetical protein F4777DRAFT_349312 [Nemania sp. FL0916]|nr:hypothetical protein F4777DRAFT_349312 [Nemania sp. FL0916]
MMPGLSLNTDTAASGAPRQHQPAAHRGSASAHNSSSAPTRTFKSTTPIPVPIPMSISTSVPVPYTSREPPQISPRSTSPPRPTYSPITPPLTATTFPPRPTYTHSSHVDATAAPAPAPEPIDFDANPDVLALKSAISILQMQRRKAERDMATLGRIKTAAVAEPEAFIRDLTTGRAHVEGERLLLSGGKDGESDSDSDSSSDGDEDGGAGQQQSDAIKQTSDAPAQPQTQALSHTQPQLQSQPQQEPTASANIRPEPEKARSSDPPPWTAIPKPQNIVRCPPINWSQYAVVGESLDKLHKEQVQRPAQGTPAIVTADGRFEFRGGVGKQEPYVGVAAPYAPGKDRIDAKAKKMPPKR